MLRIKKINSKSRLDNIKQFAVVFCLLLIVFLVHPNIVFASEYSDCMAAIPGKCNTYNFNFYSSEGECNSSEANICSNQFPAILPKFTVHDDPIEDNLFPWLFFFTEGGSTGGGHSSSPSPSPEPDKDDGTPRDKTCYPVQIATGEKIMDETDYIGTGEMPLEISRHYASMNKGGIFADRWATPFDSKLVFLFTDKSICKIGTGNADPDCNKTMSPSTLSSVTNDYRCSSYI